MNSAPQASRYDDCFRVLPRALAHHVVTAGMATGGGARGGKTAAAARLLSMLGSGALSNAGPMGMLPVVLEQVERHPAFSRELSFSPDEEAVLRALEQGVASDDLWAALLAHADADVRLRAQMAMGMSGLDRVMAP